MLTRRRMVALSAATLAHPLMTGGVRAQTWPNRFVRLVVPFAAVSYTHLTLPTTYSV